MGTRVRGVVLGKGNSVIEEIRENSTLEIADKAKSDREGTYRTEPYKSDTNITEIYKSTPDSRETDKAAIYKNADNSEARSPEALKTEPVKEIAFFSEPKRVKKKTQRSIFLFQLLFCSSICFVMLISKLTMPPLYENLHVYLTRLLGW